MLTPALIEPLGAYPTASGLLVALRLRELETNRLLGIPSLVRSTLACLAHRKNKGTRPDSSYLIAPQPGDLSKEGATSTDGCGGVRSVVRGRTVLPRWLVGWERQRRSRWGQWIQMAIIQLSGNVLIEVELNGVSDRWGYPLLEREGDIDMHHIAMRVSCSLALAYILTGPLRQRPDHGPKDGPDASIKHSQTSQSFDTVRKNITEEERKDVNDGKAFFLHEEISASQLITLGIDLEEQQYVNSSLPPSPPNPRPDGVESQCKRMKSLECEGVS
ncbi:hypothetical protein DFP72DRAFT_853183 [Ephemerocybe angulata]|uniref:Uncharacterized protein n=1 Tax=Ephemerocybe angulata TaxID=980116 RepID=A0A8H6HKP3_9AGAR|nr:hypothetical protein DFP72DRAFT_853183 [Tulosesus angulatus]